jgi:glycosyltransferase involved in cell wall biosynthesis
MTRRFLLLTDILPATNYSGGLHLAELCRQIPSESLEVVAIVNPWLAPQLPADLAGLRVHHLHKPDELVAPRRKILRGAAAFAIETRRTLGARSRVAQLAFDLVYASAPDAVWCLLEGQTMIQVGRLVRRNWKGTFLSQVMDPPLWWLRAHQVDRLSCRRSLTWFDEVLRSSARCATASWAMADRYRESYGVETVPLVPSLDMSAITEPERDRERAEAFVIALAGQIYAQDSWEALLAALDHAGWRIDGRDVVLRILGPLAPEIAERSPRVEFLGWRPQAETLSLLASADVLYCPYWFDPAFEEQARLSFPSKLTTYFAAGRPVLFHGPAYSSPAEFVERHEAALCCTSLDARDILDSLTVLAEDDAIREALIRNARSALAEHLSRDAQRAYLARFLGVDEDFLVGAESAH